MVSQVIGGSRGILVRIRGYFSNGLVNLFLTVQKCVPLPQKR